MRRTSTAFPALLALVALAAAPTACGPSLAGVPARAPVAAQWFDRAKAGYKNADFDDASESAKRALAAAPNDTEIRELAARISLVRLDFAEALKQTEGLESTEAHGIRGRAYWFSGDLEHAADELEAMLADPKVKDAWAHDVAGLARRGGGRHPFEMDGGSVGAIEMPRQLGGVALGAANVVPCELDGERVLALVATGSSEVLIDANSRHEPAWVDMRFDRVEIKDVPALVQDLSPLTRQLGLPIKALIGAQLLRHAHATFDRRGDQFVVRRQDATAPPEASRVPLYYLRGGGMLMRASVTTRDDDLVPLLVDSSRPFPLLLQDGAWGKAGVDVHTLAPLPDDPTIKRGIVPMFRIGGYDLAKMPAIEGVDLHELTSGIDIDLGGVVGADLLAFFRITFADDGRFMWLEPDPSLLNPNQRAPQGAPAGPPPGAPPGPAPGSATAPSAPPASQPPASSR
jgi:tetratricopeptide (TPR) repeat protein